MVNKTGPDEHNNRESEVSGQVQSHMPNQLMPIADDKMGSETDSDKTEENILQEALKESQENRDRWLRAVADLENFKKRSMQDRTKILKYKEEDLLRELLPVIDNLERALTHGHQEDESNPVTQGVKMVLGMFNEVLKKYGVIELDSLGKTFDPQFHEAIAQEPTQDVGPNTVTRELERGYMYKDKLLRPAKVVVSTLAK
ncbi:MAG: nucleotide exchange factor GrpE [Syntrophaceae bacterium]|nr:nucleotide exchange factor GrpE [Syntrophaceae bacterium]